MSRRAVQWQRSVDRVMARFRQQFLVIQSAVSVEARPTVLGLFGLRRVKVDEGLEGGFFYDSQAGEMRLGASGLDLIFEAGKRRDFDGLTVDEFREVAVALYLFHEWHHVSQGLAKFDDVQALKRTALENKLGELDTIADAVAAQIFACMEAAEEQAGRDFYAAAFFVALRFMIRVCFPAFGFPETRRHKAQRALGIVLMTVATERAIQGRLFADAFDAPLYPYLSDDYREIVVIMLGQQPTQLIRLVKAELDPDAIREILSAVEGGDFEYLLERARALV